MMRGVRLVAVVSALAALAACGSDSTGPGDAAREWPATGTWFMTYADSVTALPDTVTFGDFYSITDSVTLMVADDSSFQMREYRTNSNRSDVYASSGYFTHPAGNDAVVQMVWEITRYDVTFTASRLEIPEYGTVYVKR
jgi:hypothetical protein